MEKYLLTVRTSLPKMQTTDSWKVTFWTFLYEKDQPKPDWRIFKSMTQAMKYESNQNRMAGWLNNDAC